MMLRHRLVGTVFGRVAQSIRHQLDWIGARQSYGESTGTVANDRIAEILVTRLCMPGGGFLDVGAHIGSIMASVAHHQPSAKLYAVEAIPEKAAWLRRKFPAATILECAAGDHEGEVQFFINESRSGYSSLSADNAGAEDRMREIRVKMCRIDRLIGGAPIDVIKIDVEGAELGAVRGLEALMIRDKPTIMFESAPPADAKARDDRRALWQWFADHDYTVLIPNRVAHGDGGLGLESFIDAHIYPRRTTNYFAVARTRRDEIRARARHCLGFD
ncbi:MAG: FkbM family methyltransferase [Sphingomonadaceae bacterium]